MTKALPPLALCTLLCVLLVVAVLVSLSHGPVPDVVTAVLGGRADGIDMQTARTILFDVRAPRVLCGVFVGAALGASGAALQALFKNPLADPGVLGVTSTAGLGAVLAIYFGGLTVSTTVLPVAALAGALVGTVVILLVARSGIDQVGVILAGVALSALASALISLAINLSPNPTSTEDVVLWLLGSLAGRSFDDLALLIPLVCSGLVLLLSNERSLQLLTLPEDEAISLGVNVKHLRAWVITGTALGVGGSVAVAGIIGFVGLVSGHVVRRLQGYAPRLTLINSALFGALLVVVADNLARALPVGGEIKLGVVTALLGAPFFLSLVLARYRGGARAQL